LARGGDLEGLLEGEHRVRLADRPFVGVRTRQRRIGGIAFRRAALDDGGYRSSEIDGSFRVAGPGAAEGFIVVRPEFMRLLARPGDAENVIEGALYNSYSLGSRQQYRVRAGDKVLVVEQSRAAGATPDIDSRVVVGWDSRDALFVET
jgi:spermidine/putrescine transport system ATP-binding protein